MIHLALVTSIIFAMHSRSDASHLTSTLAWDRRDINPSWHDPSKRHSINGRPARVCAWQRSILFSPAIGTVLLHTCSKRFFLWFSLQVDASTWSVWLCALDKTSLVLGRRKMDLDPRLNNDVSLYKQYHVYRSKIHYDDFTVFLIWLI